MEENKQIYKTVKDLVEPVLFKDRASKFWGYIFKVTTEEEVKEKLNFVRKEHHSARHHCYGYQIGVNAKIERANDDGEPSYSAGKPILNQILAEDLTNTLIVVVRYFGGVKLGVGGLINAYRTAAQMAIEETKIIEIEIKDRLKLEFDYVDLNYVMRVLKHTVHDLESSQMQENCKYIVAVNKGITESFITEIKKQYKIKIKLLE